MVALAPQIQSLNPNTGPSTGGTTVVLTGQHFTNVTGVQFGSHVAPSCTVNSDTQITAISPQQGSGNVSVGVVAGGGQLFGAANFIYT